MIRSLTLCLAFGIAAFALNGCRTAEDALYIGLAGEAPGQPKPVKWKEDLEAGKAKAEAEAAAKAPPKPLMTIRFTSPDVNYRDELFRAVDYTVQRRPDVLFDVVATAPGTVGTGVPATSRERIGGVIAALADMGIPASRVRLSSVVKPGAAFEEVRIYVR